MLHVIPPGLTPTVRAQAEQALAAFLKQHARGHADGILREASNVRNAILKEAEKSDLVIMGASAAPEGSAVASFLFGVLPETIATRARPPVIVVKTRERIDTATFEELAAGASRSPPRNAPPSNPGRRPRAGRAMVRGVQLPPRGVP